MILAVMSLQQWVAALGVQNEDGLSPELLLSGLDRLQHTQVKVLLLATEEDEPDTLIDAARGYDGVIDLDHDEAMLPSAPVMVKRVVEESGEAYINAIRRSYPRIASIEAPKAIVSFTPTVPSIDEMPQFSFHNPGRNGQYYHDWLESYLPIQPTRHTIVMCVGEVVPQKREKAVQAFVSMILQRYSDLYTAELGLQVGQLIMAQEAAPDGYIYQLKMGRMEESVFDTRMVELIQTQTNIEISTEEFNRMWQAANPEFHEVSPGLEQVSASKLRREGYDFEFISFTNPKDMNRLRTELQCYDANYHVAKGNLIGLAGLRLSCSYIEQKSLSQMIETLQRNESHPASFLEASTPQKSKAMRPIYFVTSRTELTPELNEIATLPGVTLLLGWDKSPLHEWVHHQSALLEQSTVVAKI